MTIYQIMFHFLWTFCTQIDNQALLDQIVTTDCILAEHTFSLCAAFGHSYRDLCILDKPLIFIALFSRVGFLWDRAQPHWVNLYNHTWELSWRLDEAKTSIKKDKLVGALLLCWALWPNPIIVFHILHHYQASDLCFFLIIKTDNFKHCRRHNGPED